MMKKLVRSVYFSDDIFKKHTHYHDCYQILLILKGSVQICVAEAKYQACAGSIVIFSRYENHSIRILSEEYERYVLSINLLTDSNNRIYSLLSNRPLGFQNILDVSDNILDFEQIFAKILGEFELQKKLSDDMLQLLVNELLIMIYRHMPKISYFLDEENFEMIWNIQRRFEDRFYEKYTLEALAREYNVSVSSLSHQFKKITGSSVMEYLLSCRLASAKNYLVGTNMPVGEIVERCGFSDSSNFSRTFKKMTGISPSGFRNKYKP